VRISPDGKKLIALYINYGIRCRITDLATKRYTDIPITAGWSDTYYYYMSLAPDNDKIIFVSTGNSSTSYVYSQSTSKLTQFNNVTKEVYQGYIF